MPNEMTISYKFGGPATQDYYSQREMAEALEISEKELRRALDPFMYGNGWIDPNQQGYCYHLHPLANGGENEGTFLFTRATYQHNLVIRNTRRWMKQAGLWTNPDACGAFLSSVSSRVAEGEMDETEFRFMLPKFINAWNDGDTKYDHGIKAHYEVSHGVLRIYRALNLLDGLDCQYNWDGVTFYGPDEPETGTFIPWIKLGLSKALGFFDLSQVPYTRTEIVPTVEELRRFDFVGYESSAVKNGDIISGERWVYDDYVPFYGRLIARHGSELTITQDGRLLDNIQESEVQLMTWRTN